MRNWNLLKSHVSEIHVKRIRINQRVGVRIYANFQLWITCFVKVNLLLSCKTFWGPMCTKAENNYYCTNIRSGDKEKCSIRNHITHYASHHPLHPLSYEDHRMSNTAKNQYFP